MRARLMNMAKDMKRLLGIYSFQFFNVVDIVIVQQGWKYPRETKWVNCINTKTKKPIRFLWYEVEIIE